MVRGRFRRHCDHDADVPVFRRRSEEEICVSLEETPALLPFVYVIALSSCISL
jgi:hypothetical protein